PPSASVPAVIPACHRRTGDKPGASIGGVQRGRVAQCAGKRMRIQSVVDGAGSHAVSGESTTAAETRTRKRTEASGASADVAPATTQRNIEERWPDIMVPLCHQSRLRDETAEAAGTSGRHSSPSIGRSRAPRPDQPNGPARGAGWQAPAQPPLYRSEVRTTRS